MIVVSHNRELMFDILYVLFAVGVPEYSCESKGFVYIGATRGQYLNKTHEPNMLACARKCLETTAQLHDCKASSFNSDENTCRLLLTMNNTSAEDTIQPHHNTWQTYKMTQCIDGWLRWKRACYKIYTDVANWTVAKRQCRDIGAHLTALGDPEEAKFVWKKIVLVQATGNVFLGGRDIEEETVWRWEDGDDDIQNDSLVSLGDSINDWREGEPNNMGEEDCLIVKREGTWNDAKCDIELPFICKYHL
jgi:hypothetical protein